MPEAIGDRSRPQPRRWLSNQLWPQFTAQPRSKVPWAGLGREPYVGLTVLPDSSSTVYRQLIASLAAQCRVPANYPYRYFVISGGLISYGTDIIELYRGAASYVNRVLRGEKPAELPVQAPTNFELVINLKAAEALGLKVSERLLARADQIIE